MADTSRHGGRQGAKSGPEEPGAKRQPDEAPAVEEEPAVEWGERIDTGKTIARGGKETGHVSGATDQPTPGRE